MGVFSGTGDSVKDIVDDQVERRAYFVDSLLEASGSETITHSDVSNNASKEKFLHPHTTEDKTVPVDFTGEVCLWILFWFASENNLKLLLIFLKHCKMYGISYEAGIGRI